MKTEGKETDGRTRNDEHGEKSRESSPYSMNGRIGESEERMHKRTGEEEGEGGRERVRRYLQVERASMRDFRSRRCR